MGKIWEAKECLEKSYWIKISSPEMRVPAFPLQETDFPSVFYGYLEG